MQIISNYAQGNEPVIADTSWHYYEASYYQQAAHVVYFRSEDNTKIGAYAMLRTETTNKIIDMAEFARLHPVAWFVTSQARDDSSKLPRGWKEIKTYLVESPSELRVVKMQYVGNGA